MHVHWGSCGGKGSEHTLEGKEYDAELHIVHWNTKYGSPENAADKPDGLAVLGMFIQEGEIDHPEFAKLVDSLKAITKNGSKAAISASIDPPSPGVCHLDCVQGTHHFL